MLIRQGHLRNEFINRGVSGFAASSSIDTLVQILVAAIQKTLPWYLNLPLVSWFVGNQLNMQITKALQLIEAWFGVNVISYMVKGSEAQYEELCKLFESLPENANEEQVQKVKDQFDKALAELINIRILRLQLGSN